MAKGSGNKGGDGRSKVRFIMLEADLGEGDLDQVTQAIANALRPVSPPVQRRLVSSGSGNGSIPAQTAVDDAEEVELIEDDAEYTDEAGAKAERGPARPRKYPSPKVLSDIDLESAVSFPSFAAEKQPKSLADRYLTVAAWFKLHRNTDAITMNHVYTCFLHPRVKWPTNVEDFDAPLRQLKKRNRMDKTGKGLYAINQIGMADVNELGASSVQE